MCEQQFSQEKCTCISELEKEEKLGSHDYIYREVTRTPGEITVFAKKKVSRRNTRRNWEKNLQYAMR